MAAGARAFLALAALASVSAGAEPPGTAAAERLYRLGVLPSGQPLKGLREGGVVVEGVEAACATCHRRSGLGSYEGQTVIPPIAGPYLFQERSAGSPAGDHAGAQGPLSRRPPYTDAALARAIRDGVAPDGRRLAFLMPRFRLDEATLAALVGYLRGLGAGEQPGVTPDTLHFATVVAPDADPRARQGMLDVLRQFFADKNAGYRGDAPPLKSSRGVMYRVQRRWQLHVWELNGPPGTWEAQLQAKQRAEPVLAVISGLAGRTWAPVHAFCEHASVPCLLPNAELPVATAEQDFFSVYYSRGVLLEADLVARQLQGPGRQGLKRVVQVFAPDDLGAEASKALAAGLPGLAVVARPLGPGPDALPAALAGLGPDDALVLWLRPGQLAALPAPPPVKAVYLSGLMGGLEQAPLPAAWRPASHLAYPFDLPEQRKVRMNFPLGWFGVRHVPVVSERVQTDSYLACVILAETLGHMQEAFVREYLVERLEMLLSHRVMNGYYPRLSLAPGQRFASKGGYLVRFAAPEGTRLLAETGWVVP